MMGRQLLVFFHLAVVLFCGGCGNKLPTQKNATLQEKSTATFRGEYPISATVTVGMVADLVREIGGEKVKVMQLLGDGVDPHLYKPTRDDVQAIMRADIVFYNGLMLEGKMAETLTELGNSKTSVPVAELLEPGTLGNDPQHSAHPDPHVWMDVNLWSQVGKIVGERLAQFDPSNAQHYQQRSEALRAKLDRLHVYGQQVMRAVPAERRVLVTSHDAFRYFGKAYEVEVQAVQGISTESEAGLQRINELVDMLVSRNVQNVFIESSVPKESIEALLRGAASRNHKVKVAGELFSDAMGRDGTYEGTYIGMMDHNLTSIAKALGSDQVPANGFRGFEASQ